MRFSYTRSIVVGTRPNTQALVFRPMVRVRVIGPAGTFKVLARVDTGADDTVLSNGISHFVGLTSLTAPVLIGGIGSQVAIRFGTVDLEIGDGQTIHR